MLVDPRQPYIWLLYVLILFVYSGVALGISWDGSKSPILSSRNIKPRGEILLVHAVFLGIMFNILLFATRLYVANRGLARAWWSFHIYRRLTPLDCALFAAVYVVAMIEQRFIYIDGKTGKKDLPGDLDYF
jgi:hypothetical protein